MTVFDSKDAQFQPIEFCFPYHLILRLSQYLDLLFLPKYKQPEKLVRKRNRNKFLTESNSRNSIIRPSCNHRTIKMTTVDTLIAINLNSLRLKDNDNTYD